MRIKSKVNLRIFEDTDEEDVLFGPSDDGAEITSDQFTEEHSDRFSIAASGSLNPGLGSIGECLGVYIRAKGDFDLTLNGSADVIEVRRYPEASSSSYAKFYFDGVITSLLIENPSLTTALVGNFAMFGDPE